MLATVSIFYLNDIGENFFRSNTVKLN